MIAPLPDRPVKRVAFLGTPEIATGVLRSLVEHGYDVPVVVTRGDKRRGRGSSLVPSPVKRVAALHGLKVVHSVEELLEMHRSEAIDLGIVVAFGEIIKPHVLAEIPMVNLHVSLLPRWRGAAPVERAILAGDEVTGVCLMQVEEGLDTGGIISSSEISIDSTRNADEIREQLIEEGTVLLLGALRTGKFDLEPQRGEVSYAAKIEREEHRILWTESAAMVSRRVRIGGAWTSFRGHRFKIHSARIEAGLADAAMVEGGLRARVGSIIVDANEPVVVCGDGEVRLLTVQSEGRPRVSAGDWLRGARVVPGEFFEDV